MPITSFNQAPYFDDFNIKDTNDNNKTVKDKNYLRILFQPGFAVQTRELNQLQSVIQNQIEQLGNVSLKEGQAIIGDDLPQFSDDVDYMEFIPDSTALSTNFAGSFDSFVDNLKLQKTITDDSGKIAKILDVTQFTNATGTFANVKQVRVFLSYEKSEKFSTAQTETDVDGVEQSVGLQDDEGKELFYRNSQFIDSLNVTNTYIPKIGVLTKVGLGFTYTIRENVYFINGSFVHVPDQTIFFRKPATPSVKGELRFTVTENQVNTSTDSTLLDNANGSLNFAAPGADRYQIVLTPIFIDQTNGGAIKTENTGATNVFLESENVGNSKRLVTVEQGVVTSDVGSADTLIDKQLSSRTKETDGDYVIQPFRISYRQFFKDTSGDFDNGYYTSTQILNDNPFGVTTDSVAKDSFIVEVDTSIAYVNGNRYKYPDKVLLKGDKARTTQKITNESFSFRYGHYVDFNQLNNSPVDNTLDSPAESRTDNIKSMRGSVAGITQIHTFEGEDLGRTLANSDEGQLVFRLPYKGVKSLTGFSYVKTRKYTGVPYDASNDIIITSNGNFPSTSVESGDEDEYGIIDATGKVLRTDSSPTDYSLDSLNSNTSSVKFNIGDPGSFTAPFTVFAPELVSNGVSREKTIQSGTVGFTAIAGSTPTNTVETSVELLHSDPFIKENFSNISVISAGTTEVITTAKIKIIDDGQRNDRYVRPKIGVTGVTAGADFTLSYQYFSHGSSSAGGDYFTVDSYTNAGVNYCDIPKFKGESIADFIDFRIKQIPDALDDPNVSQLIPRPNTEGTINDLDVYLPRQDRIVITDAGSLDIVQGEPSLDPKLPVVPNNSMTLYEIFVPYFTCKLRDIKNKYIDNSRYTQRQIGDIDRRLQSLEYDKALNNVETFATEASFLNEEGTSLLFKSAFIADNFSGHAIGDTEQIDYLVAIDRANKEARPYYKQKNIKFIYDFPAAATPEDKLDDVSENQVDSSAPDETYTFNQSDTVVDTSTVTRPNMVCLRRPNIGSATLPDDELSFNLPLTFSNPHIDVYQTTPSHNGYRLIRYKKLSVGGGAYPTLVSSVSRILGLNLPSDVTNSDEFEGKFTPLRDVVILQYNARTIRGNRRITGYPQNGSQNWYGIMETDGNAAFVTGGSITNLKPGRGNSAELQVEFDVTRVFAETGADSAAITSNVGLSQIEVINDKTPAAKEKASKVVDGASTAEILSLWEGETETLFDQRAISQTIGVQPFEIAKYSGDVTLSPSSDEWIDTETRPEVVINNNGAMDALQFLQDNGLVDFDGVLGTEWDSWERTVQGVENIGTRTRNTGWMRNTGRAGRGRPGRIRTISRIQRVTVEENRTGTESTLGSDIIEQDAGERVVDISIIPFIRSRDITFRARGLKPGTQHYVFFDGQDVTRYCSPTPRFIRYSERMLVRTYNRQGPPDSRGARSGFVTTRPGSFNAYDTPIVSTMEKGDLTGVFRIPNNSDLQFRTGTREFKLTTSPNDNDTESDSIASTTYTASGLLQSKEAQQINTRVPTVVQTTVEQTRLTTFRRERVISRFRWDPIAQTFIIPESSYENGVFVNDVDIYFAEKPTASIDVQVYLVPTELGIPTTEIIEGSRSVKRMEDVVVSGREPANPSTDIVPTNFRFERPLHLKPNVEYAMIVFSNSVDYKVWTSVLGQSDIRTQNTITDNSSIGVFLKSQNTRTWTPDQTRDLAFKMNKCKFVASKDFTFQTKLSDTDKQDVDTFDFSLFNLNQQVVKLPKTNITHKIEFLGANNNVIQTLDNVRALENEFLDTAITTAHNIRSTVTLSTTDDNISPLFDLERYSMFAIQNTTSNVNASTREGYVTREVVLLNPSTITRVLLDVNKPSSASNVHVYVNYDGARNPVVDGVGGDLIYQTVPLISADGVDTNEIPVTTEPEDFANCEFNLNNPAGTYEKFRLKIIFTSTDSANVCRIKNLVGFALL